MSNKKALQHSPKHSKKDTDFIKWLILLDGDLIVNLVLYVDESGTHDQTGQQRQSQVATVAGDIAKPESWVKFQKDWAKFLGNYRVSVFHFTDLKVVQRRAEEGNPVSDPKNPYLGWDADKCKSFLMEGASIAASGNRIPVCGDVDIFGVFTARQTETIPGPANPQEGAISWFYSSALGSIQAKWPQFRGKISFFFDQSDPNSPWASAIYRIHYEWKRTDARISSVVFGDKRDPKYYGLQAADLVAGRLRQLTRMKKGYETSLSGPLSDLDRILFQKFGPSTYEDLLQLRTSR